MLRPTLITLTAGLLAIVPAVAAATEYYVDNSCTYYGSGLAAACATAPGQSGAANDLQTLLNAFSSAPLQPGDTVFIRAGSGTYVTRNLVGTNNSSHDGAIAEGFVIYGSGTADHPITIRNYPGETPVLANCADNEDTSALCQNMTLSAVGRSYLRITGLKIRGGVGIYGSGSEAPGIVVDHNELYRGYSGIQTGNWAALRLEHLTGAWVHHNYIHDTFPPTADYSGNESQRLATSGIKLYTSVNGTYEFNTLERCNGPEGSNGAAIDDKQDAVNNTYRYNHFISNGFAWRMHAKTSVYPAIARQSLHHNLIEPGSLAGQYTVCLLVPASQKLTGIDFYNNTCVAKYGLDIGATTEVGAYTTKIYNNIFWTWSLNLIWYGSLPPISNYNLFTSGIRWSFPGGMLYETLAALRNATHYEADSAVAPGTAAGFGLAPDYHLTIGSPATSMGRTGGLPGGAATYVGAFGPLSLCVGHRCPASPRGVAIR